DLSPALLPAERAHYRQVENDSWEQTYISFGAGRAERQEKHSGVTTGVFRGTPPKERSRPLCISESVLARQMGGK
ncbi:MAG: hypothetical protein WBL22_05905, partial [Candidatus Sulfotelmatobacter sp.]